MWSPSYIVFTPEQSNIIHQATQSVVTFKTKYGVEPNHILISGDYFRIMADNEAVNNGFGGLRTFRGLQVLVCQEMRSEVVACLC